MLQYYTLPAACSNPSGLFQQICFTPCKYTMTHTHTHTQESTQAGVSPAHPDPRCRPVAACLKSNHLYRERKNSSGCLRAAGRAGPITTSAKQLWCLWWQLRRSEEWKETLIWGVVEGRTPHRRVHFLFKLFQSGGHRNGFAWKKQCVQKQCQECQGLKHKHIREALTLLLGCTSWT